VGLCTEFGPHIHPGCDHAMVPGADQCYCAVCNTACTGRFAGCAAVWARGPQTISLIPRPSSTNGVAANGASRDQVAPLVLEQSTSVTFDDPVLEALKSEIALLDRRIREVSSPEQATLDLRASVDGLSGLIEALPDRLATALATLLKRQHDLIIASVSTALDTLRSQITAQAPAISDEQGHTS
jgi:hypothetical protein